MPGKGPSNQERGNEERGHNFKKKAYDAFSGLILFDFDARSPPRYVRGDFISKGFG
jgi:hypothetical protein